MMSRTGFTFVWKDFAQLTLQELYALLQLRAEVFVVEQRCAFADPDGMDAQARHLLVWHADALVGTARMFAPPPGESPAAHGAKSSERLRGHASIGRIVTAPSVRGTGVGRAIMREALGEAARAFPGAPIRIGAQAQLRAFYESFGFCVAGSAFLEDGIPHLPMRKA